MQQIWTVLQTVGPNHLGLTGGFGGLKFVFDGHDLTSATDPLVPFLQAHAAGRGGAGAGGSVSVTASYPAELLAFVKVWGHTTGPKR